MTRVELFYLEDHVNYWLRFGDFNFEKNIDRRRAFVWFRPNHLICYIRWWANAHGTQSWTLAILRSCPRYETVMQTYPGISPGIVVLLRVRGKKFVKNVLETFDQIEGQGIGLCDVSPDYYRYLGQSISARSEPHPYGIEQHRAFQKLQDIAL